MPASSSREWPEFRTYLEVRDAVVRILDRASGGGASAYWREELENIDYLVEASPLIIRKLRHHAFHITNRRPYDYRDKGDGRREFFEARLRALQALDPAGLLVPESPQLGGFGYTIDGALHNVDTLKYYEVLVGMQRAGLLEPFREGHRQTVWEIGAGWGGFAYQLKQLFPNITCVITDFPELFLFSATYLRVHFPEARVHFAGGDPADDPAGWSGFDFVFVPVEATVAIAHTHVDLAVNMVSFQEMTGEQVRGYARLASEAGCRALYSLNRDRSPFNAELTSVSEVLGEYFDLRDVLLLDSDYTSVNKKAPKPGKAPVREALTYRHLAGVPRSTRPSLLGRLARAFS